MEQINLSFQAGSRERLKAAAAEAGESASQYIATAVNTRAGRLIISTSIKDSREETAPEPQDAKQLRMIAPAETPEEAPPPKRRGRPAGSKDKHPRGSRTTGGEQTNIEPEQE